jgi:hypothetical protein
MAPHTKTLQNQGLQGFPFSSISGIFGLVAYSVAYSSFRLFFLPRLGDCIGHNIGRMLGCFFE